MSSGIAGEWSLVFEYIMERITVWGEWINMPGSSLKTTGKTCIRARLWYSYTFYDLAIQLKQATVLAWLILSNAKQYSLSQYVGCMVNLGRFGGVNTAKNCGHQQPNITSRANYRPVVFFSFFRQLACDFEPLLFACFISLLYLRVQFHSF